MDAIFSPREKVDMEATQLEGFIVINTLQLWGGGLIPFDMDEILFGWRIYINNGVQIESLILGEPHEWTKSYLLDKLLYLNDQPFLV